MTKVLTAKAEELKFEEEKELSQRSMISRICYRIVCSAPFNILITILIILNTYFLASYRYDESVEYTELKQAFDNFFVAMFTIELVLKLVGFGPRAFVKDKLNIFDTVIVAISFLEAMLSLFMNEKYLHGMSIMKAMRTIRMLKLTRYFSGMRKLLNKLYAGLKDISGFAVIVLLFIFIWALLGMEMFAYLVIVDHEGKYVEPSDAQKMF